MAYQTDLSNWGATGTEPPANYSYEEGEQPVDAWDNWFNNTVINELTDVIGLINDIDADTDGVVDLADDAEQYGGTAPSDGTAGQHLTTDGSSSTAWETENFDGEALSVDGWNWVDVTEASNAASDGSADVVPELDTLVADGTLLIFPEGTYRFDQTFSVSGVDNFGMVARGNVTLESNNGASNLIDLGSSSEAGYYFDGFDIDVGTNANQGGRQIAANINDRLHIKDVTQVGQPTAGDTPFTTFQITDENGSGKIENLDLSAGDNSSDGNGHVGVLCSSGHVGQISFEDCHVEGFLSNGMYLSGAGRYHIHGGTFKNSSTAQLRFNGGPGYVTGAEIVVDDTTGLSSPRGVWWRGSGPHHIENSDIRVEVLSGSDPVSVPNSESPGGIIENTHIRDERNGWATRINAVNLDAHLDEDHDPLVFDSVKWEYNKHHADNDQDEYAIRVHRPSTYFRDCHIEDFNGNGSQSPTRNAIQVRAANVHFRGGSIINDGWCVNVVANTPASEYDHITFSEVTARSRSSPDNIYESILIGANDGTTGSPTADSIVPRNVRISNLNTDNHEGFGWSRYGVVDFGIRTLIDGMGKNEGDPNDTGVWNDTTDLTGEDIYRWQPGVRVVDTLTDDVYEYNGEADEWRVYEQKADVKQYEEIGAAKERQDIKTRSISAGTQFAEYDWLSSPDHIHVAAGDDFTFNFNAHSSPANRALSADNNSDPLRREVTATIQDYTSATHTGGADNEAAAIGENYYAVGDVNGDVHIYSVQSNEQIGILDDPGSGIIDMDFGDRILAVSTGGSETYYYEVGTWELLQNISAGHPIDGVGVGGTDDEYVALGARGGYVRVYDTTTWTELHEFTDTGGDIVRHLDMDDEWLVYGAWDSNTYVRPVNPDSSTAVGALAATLDDHVSAGTNVEAVATAGGYVAHGGGNNEVYVYDSADWTTPTATLTEPGFIQSMGAYENDLTPGGSDYGYLAVGDANGDVNVYDLDTFTNTDTYTNSDNVFGVDCHEAMTVHAARAAGSGVDINENTAAAHTITWGGNSTITWDGGSATTSVGSGETVEIRFTSQDGGFSWRARTVATYS